MDEQELNKKLAEWAGFTRTDIGMWARPEMAYTIDLPDFTDSLDACFKWLVPKLKGYHLELNIPILGDKYQFLIMRAPDAIVADRIGAVEKNPALALCLAIEKLIDSQPE